jgi:hypothetical protein
MPRSSFGSSRSSPLASKVGHSHSSSSSTISR